MRGSNLAFLTILLYVMEKWVAVSVLGEWGEVMSSGQLILLIIAVVGIAAGGYVINDYFDVKIDRINRPERLIVTNTVTKTQAMWLFRITTGVGIAAGIVLAWICRSLNLGMLFVIIPGMLWFYSSSYKRQFMIGNLIVALVAAMTPLVVAIVNVKLLEYRYGDVLSYTTLTHDLYCWLGGFALFAFLGTWAREMVKDLQDQEGDREFECHTVPIIVGETWTKIFVTIVTMLIAALAIYVNCCLVTYAHDFRALTTRYLILALLIPMAGEVVLLWSAKIESDYKTAQMLWKFILFMGTMYSYVIMKSL